LSDLTQPQKSMGSKNAPSEAASELCSRWRGDAVTGFTIVYFVLTENIMPEL
jgi:hypothetical protein